MADDKNGVRKAIQKSLSDNEDNRDVFEKALDYAVPAAGAYLGMRAGSKLASGGESMFKKLRKSGSSTEEHFRARMSGGISGAVLGATAGGLANHQNNPPSKKRK